MNMIVADLLSLLTFAVQGCPQESNSCWRKGFRDIHKWISGWCTHLQCLSGSVICGKDVGSNVGNQANWAGREACGNTICSQQDETCQRNVLCNSIGQVGTKQAGFYLPALGYSCLLKGFHQLLLQLSLRSSSMVCTIVVINHLEEILTLVASHLLCWHTWCMNQNRLRKLDFNCILVASLGHLPVRSWLGVAKVAQA